MEDLPDCDYYAIVSRAEERPKVGVWPVRLREPLPKIPIPSAAKTLRPTWTSRPPCTASMTRPGTRYYIYQGRPNPLLHPDDAAWAAQLVPATS